MDKLDRAGSILMFFDLYIEEKEVDLMYKKRDGDEKEMTCRQVCRENQVLAFVHSQNKK
jgi:hypothetical protein